MIQANELRIGNYVNYNGNQKEVGKITALVQEIIFDLNFCHIDNRINLKIRDIKSIPLTEEWLIRLGFSIITQNSAGKRYGYVIDGIFSSDLTFVCWTTTKLKDRFFRGDLEIKHIHQLQNLYFALTNKELTLCQ